LPANSTRGDVFNVLGGGPDALGREIEVPSTEVIGFSSIATFAPRTDDSSAPTERIWNWEYKSFSPKNIERIK
jgi:hypothetical protein